MLKMYSNYLLHSKIKIEAPNPKKKHNTPIFTLPVMGTHTHTHTDHFSIIRIDMCKMQTKLIAKRILISLGGMLLADNSQELCRLKRTPNHLTKYEILNC